MAFSRPSTSRVRTELPARKRTSNKSSPDGVKDATCWRFWLSFAADAAGAAGLEIDRLDTTVGGGGGGGGASDLAEGAIGALGADVTGVVRSIAGAFGKGALGGGGALTIGAFIAGGGGGGGAKRASLGGTGASMGAFACAFMTGLAAVMGAMGAAIGAAGGLAIFLRASVFRGADVGGDVVAGVGIFIVGSFATRRGGAGGAFGRGAAATGATGAGGTRVRVATIGVLAAAGMFTLGCWRACKGGVARMGMVRRKFGISNLRPPGRPGSGAKCDCIEGAGAT